MKRNNFFYYDYAGGTYYIIKLSWYFDCPKELEALVWTNGEKIMWHLHGGNNVDGVFKDDRWYTEEIFFTNELRAYFHQQRYWQDKYKKCENKNERIAVSKSFKECI